jgi:hypothetical protein
MTQLVRATDWIQNSSTLHVSITWLRHGRATAGVQRTQLVTRLLTDSSTGKEKRKQEGVERFTKKDWFLVVVDPSDGSLGFGWHQFQWTMGHAYKATSKLEMTTMDSWWARCFYTWCTSVFFLNNTIIYYSNEQYMVEIYKLSPAITK